ncbi:stage III sporulation protein SpoIIIAB [Mechercharimyces sp. CAU 1602]|uniref:stage III sporulation protein SpoIIIAB n=1 Tax=Mechercharimyces sp. CAU 1602 TaxID=2973933 RepID=UPI00216141ED|nr:stage III sporulation protein SpoIIIAB [Mechercharimyces sp. CAU 1602]MCS1350772.1 stage III sporulation protein SpoIIIAB [Mechercharimyces sp. CAU 1602]
MMKLFGAILILISTSISGWMFAKRFAERPKQIRQLCQALALLETDIVYGSRPLSEAFAHIAHREPAAIGSIFHRCAVHLQELDGASTFECWEKALSEVWPRLDLQAAEKEILLDFGKTLGMSDRDDQLQHLQLTVSNLQVEENHAREEQGQYEKMWKSVGVLGGALLIILLY